MTKKTKSKKTKKTTASKTTRKSSAAPWGYKKGTKVPKKRPGQRTLAELAAQGKKKKAKKRT